jgi:hypothetical protein
VFVLRARAEYAGRAIAGPPVLYTEAKTIVDQALQNPDKWSNFYRRMARNVVMSEKLGAQVSAVITWKASAKA